MSGSPHIAGTRLENRAIAALFEDGYSADSVAALYPFVTAAQITQTLELEQQLTQNLRIPVRA